MGRFLARLADCAVHANPSPDARDIGDAKVAGVAREVTGEAKNAHATGSEPAEDFHAFRSSSASGAPVWPSGPSVMFPGSVT